MGGRKEEEIRLYSVVPSSRTNVNGHRLKHRKSHLNIRKSLFTMRILECWHQLVKEVMESPSLEIF